MRWQLIDRIVDCVPGVSAVGEKTFPASEELFLDHFPGYPIVPGVLQIEMIAQMAGKCAALTLPGKLPVLGTVRSAKFYRQLRPEERCLIKVQIEKIASQYVQANGEIEVDGQRAAAVSVMFGLIDRAQLSSESFDRVTQDWLARQKGSLS